MAKAHRRRYDAIQHHAPPPKGDTPVSTLQVSGAAGEVAHPNYYGPKDTNANSDKRLTTYAKAFFDAPLVREERKHLGRAIFWETVKSAEDHGVEALARLDYWYIFCRLRRWAGGNWNVNSVLPFTTPSFVRAGVRQPIDEKFSSQLHRRLIAMAAPFWSDIPFFHERMHEVPLRERTTGGALPSYWETGKIAELLQLLHEFESDLRPIYVHGFIEQFKSAGGSRKEVRFQNYGDRILWHIGFLENLKSVRAAAQESTTATARATTL